MKNNYFKTIFEKLNEYDKQAKNPFINHDYETNPFKNLHEQTYIWIEKNRD